MGRGIVASATIEIDTLVPLLLFGIASILHITRRMQVFSKGQGK